MTTKQDNKDADKKAPEPSATTRSLLRHLCRQRWVRVISYIVIAGVVVITAAPIAMKHYLQRWLVNNGADEARINDIDFNPFSGSLRFEGLDTKIADRTVMGDVDIYIDIGLTALLTRTITVERATLDDVQLEIERLDDGRMRIGSLVLGEADAIEPALSKTLEGNGAALTKAAQPVADPTATTEAGREESGQPWRINLRQLQMSNSEIRYLSPELNTTLAITSATVDRVYTGFSSERGDVRLEGTLDGAPLKLTAAININPGITLRGTAKVDGLELDPLRGLVKEQVKDLGGALSADGDIAFSDGRDRTMSASYEGSVSLADAVFGNQELSISGRSAGWTGAISFDANGPAQTIGIDGTLEGTGLDLRMPARQVHLQQSAIKVSGKSSINLVGALEAKYDGDITLGGHRLKTPDFEVAGGSLAWNGAAAFVDKGDTGKMVDLDGKLSSNDLSAKLNQQAVHASQREIGIETRKVKLTLTADNFDISGSAALNMANTEVRKSDTDALLLSLAGLTIQDVALQSKEQLTIPSIELTGLEAGDPQVPDLRIALDSLALESVRVADLNNLSVSHVRASRLRAVDQAKDLILAQLSAFDVTGVEASGAKEVSAETISLGETTVLSKVSDPEVPPLGKIGGTKVSALTYTPEGVTIDAVKIDAVKANIIREPAKEAKDKPPAGEKGAPAKADADDKDDAQVQEAQHAEDSQEGRGYRFDIGEMELTGDNVVHIEDRTVTPFFRVALRISRLELKTRDREQTFGPMDINLSGNLGEHAVLNARGMIDPSARAIDIELGMKDVNMIVLTPYTVPMMGHQVDSGHLNLDATIRIADDRIDAQNKVFLRELYMNEASEEIAAEAAEEIGMPIKKAMEMLRDKQGNISLDVPISGALSELKIGFGDAIGKALGSALKSTTIAYLKFVNPTYGVGVTVIDKVKEQIQKIRIDPIEFEAGKSELPGAAVKLLAEAAEKLKKDEKVDVRVCPHATPKDLAVISGKPVGPELEKDLLDKMFLLGHDRASEVKRALISQHAVEPGRIVICVTKYDKGENAKPRVKFSF